MIGVGGAIQTGSERPGHRRGGDEGPAMGLILAGSDHHRRNGVQVTLVLGEESRGRIVQRVQVMDPALGVVLSELVESGPERSVGRIKCGGLAGGKSQGERSMLTTREPGQG